MTPRFSIVTPVYDPPADVLGEMIESVLAQTFADWQLVLVDDRSPSPHVLDVVRSYAARDERIVVVEREGNGGIVAASNDGLAQAAGDFVGLLDHDDTLVPEALRLVDMYADRYPEMDYCYSDEDLLSPDGHYIGPFYKPDWSPERLRAQNYCTHFSVFRTALLKRIGGFRDGFDGSQDYDIILRASEAAREVVHIPFVLYHWRQLASSVATGDPAVKPYAYDAGRRAVQDHCDRVGIDATVEMAAEPGNYRVRRVAVDALTSVIIPTQGSTNRVWGIERCSVVETVRSIAATAGAPIEFVVVGAVTDAVQAALRRVAGEAAITIVDAAGPVGAMVNLGAAKATGEYLLLAHDDVEMITERFLDELVPIAGEPGTGAVGCKTLFADGRLRSGGYVFNGNPNEIMQGVAGDHPGSRGLLTVPREVAGVSGACLLLRREVFFEAGGLCPVLSDYADVDLCLKLRRLRLTRIWTPHVQLYDFSPVVAPDSGTADHEFVHRRWSHQLVDDPYFNPNLRPDRGDWVEKGLR